MESAAGGEGPGSTEPGPVESQTSTGMIIHGLSIILAEQGPVAFCQRCYRVFDRLPSVVRIAINSGDAYIDPNYASRLVRKHGERAAAAIIMDRHRRG